MSGVKLTGGCLCGTVTYELVGKSEEISGVTACHCEQCRRWSGHHWASVHGPMARFTITAGKNNVEWYKSSDRAKRGFCKTCGSTLFWCGEGYPSLVDKIDISAGSLDDGHSMELTRHIFCKFKGDYYEIKDGIPVHETFPKN